MSNYPLLKSFQRLYAKAMDESGMFSTYEDLITYVITNPTVYTGQPCIVCPVDEDYGDLYIVNDDRSLTSVTGTNEEVVVYGDAIGGYLPGDIIPLHTNLFSVVKKILQKPIPPTYVAPTLTALDTIPNSIEIGNLLTGVITPTFTQNNGGAVIGYSINLPNATPELREFETVQEVTVVTGDAFPVNSTSVNATLTVDYEQGEILNDNMGNPYPTGRIPAGSKTFIISILGYVPYFYTADTGTAAPTTSSQIRAFTNSVATASNGTTFSIPIPIGTTRIVFSYRNTLQDVTSVKFVQLGNAEMKDLFTKTSIVIAGVNGIGGGTNKVFTYLPEAPFGDNATFTVTI
jgi:hypothetical protein